MQRCHWLSASLVLLLSGCAPALGPTNQPRSQAATCPGYADLATAQTRDGRLLLQAFDSVARAIKPDVRQTVRSPGGGPSVQDSATNALLGLQVTAGPDLTQAGRREMANRVVREYPPKLIAQQKGGTVVLITLIGADGVVREVRVTQSSGYPEMDAAAVRVIRRTRLDPAMAGDCSVPYVLPLPVSFTAVAM